MSDIKKILIVEDDPASGFYLKTELESLGYNVTATVSSGLEAISSISTDIPDIILMDIIIEGKYDGIETAEKINKLYSIPIIYMSSNTDKKNIERAKKTAPSGFLIKPVKKYELYSNIESAIFKSEIDRKISESERKYRLLFEHMTDSFLYFDLSYDANDKIADLIITEVNEKFLLLTGMSKADVIRQKISSLFPKIESLKPDWREIVERIINDKATHKFRISIPETQKHFIFSVYCPQINQLAVIINDVTESKLHESIQIKNRDKILQAHQEITNILESIDSIIIGVNTQDIITHWSRKAGETFGISSEDIIGKKITNSNIKWDWMQIYEGISLCLTEDKAYALNDINFSNNTGDSGILGITINPIRNEKVEIIGFLIFGKDITEKKQMEAQYYQDQKLISIGELASGIAHEINTPTQYVNNNTHFLLDAFNDFSEIINSINEISTTDDYNKLSENLQNLKTLITEKDIEYLSSEIPVAINQSLEGLKRISEIVSSMKSFSHPETDKMIFTDVNKSINDTITITRNEWKYDSELITHFDENLPEIASVPAVLNQVFINIIVNASQAIKEAINKKIIKRGEIKIKTALKTHSLIEIIITDNGIGMKDEISRRIFDPFFTTKDVGKGTGQGLAIAYSAIVKKHKGTIQVKSIFEKGTSFIICLPVRQQEIIHEKNNIY
ncbi:MAG: PAS domain S-box protein [Spirochaetes bacterium]|nr:PAS domain S-box protein [Spirochaetota bacterium]